MIWIASVKRNRKSKQALTYPVKVSKHSLTGKWGQIKQFGQKFSKTSMNV